MECYQVAYSPVLPHLETVKIIGRRLCTLLLLAYHPCSVTSFQEVIQTTLRKGDPLPKKDRRIAGTFLEFPQDQRKFTPSVEVVMVKFLFHLFSLFSLSHSSFSFSWNLPGPLCSQHVKTFFFFSILSNQDLTQKEKNKEEYREAQEGKKCPVLVEYLFSFWTIQKVL